LFLVGQYFTIISALARNTLGPFDYYCGNNLILINRVSRSTDSSANLLIQASVGEIWGKFL
jgi:hypothetical protein